MALQNLFINQIGYTCNSNKTVWAMNVEPGAEFVINDKSGNVVFTGKFENRKNDSLCNQDVFYSDFSALKQAGVYTIKCGENESYPFSIGENLFDEMYLSTLNYFYLSRCGQQINHKIFGHVPCHTGKAKVYGTEDYVPVSGGWHDAGDYGRYVVAGTKTCMDLLLAYEAVKNSGTKNQDNCFDYLSEVRFELEWLLQMQRKDGAVFHKISCYRFCGFIVPEAEKDPIVLAPVSTTATADFAGCLAYAYKFYKDSDPEFAETILNAAVKAQEYLDTHEDEIYKNPPEITTGGYGDINVKDERYFALCSLFAATGNKKYLEGAIAVRKAAIEADKNQTMPFAKWNENFGWASVAGYGTEILLKNQQLVEDNLFIEELKKSVITKAETVLGNCNKNSFNIAANKIFWGSNGHICDEAHLLLLAYDLCGKKEYYDAAKAQFDYILGCNPLNFCYITGSGSKSPINPHHRPTGALKSVMPGMLAGGPSEGMLDAEAKKYLEGVPPLMSYLDMTGSYSTNEVAIYWNSPFVYLTARMVIV